MYGSSGVDYGAKLSGKRMRTKPLSSCFHCESWWRGVSCVMTHLSPRPPRNTEEYLHRPNQPTSTRAFQGRFHVAPSLSNPAACFLGLGLALYHTLSYHRLESRTNNKMTNSITHVVPETVAYPSSLRIYIYIFINMCHRKIPLT